MDLRFVLVVSIALAASCFADTNDAEEDLYSCFGSYLKTQDMLEREFYVSNSIAEIDCDARLDFFRTVFYKTVADELKVDDDMKEITDCMVEQMKKLHVAEISMKKIVYEQTKKMSKRKRTKAIKAIDYAIEKKMTTAVKLCTLENTFGAVFTELYAEGQKNHEEDSDDEKFEDYCLRQYMIENNFIDTTVYKINVNPYNVDVTNTTACAQAIKDSTDAFETVLKLEFDDTDIPKLAKRCIAKTVKQYNILEASTKVALLGELGITDGALEAERKVYIEKMSDLYEGIVNC